ncbi:MAG: hypothetical protein IJT62_02945 [Oscillospiraceae bacterium]|nr:hypothetical protein [Oscillospiraceae bacterium]
MSAENGLVPAGLYKVDSDLSFPGWILLGSVVLGSAAGWFLYPVISSNSGFTLPDSSASVWMVLWFFLLAVLPVMAVAFLSGYVFGFVLIPGLFFLRGVGLSLTELLLLDSSGTFFQRFIIFVIPASLSFAAMFLAGCICFERSRCLFRASRSWFASRLFHRHFPAVIILLLVFSAAARLVFLSLAP